jgi:hypothetical protein
MILRDWRGDRIVRIITWDGCRGTVYATVSQKLTVSTTNIDAARFAYGDWEIVMFW